MNDVAYDGVSSNQGLSYISNFGKIYKGETCKSVLNLMNTSTIHTLEQIKVKAVLSSKISFQKGGERILV